MQMLFIRPVDYLFVIVMFFSQYMWMANPGLFNRWAIHLSLLFIRLFSSGQLVFIKAKKYVTINYNTFVESYPQVLDVYNSIFPKKIQNDVEFIVNDTIVFSTTKEQLLLKEDLCDSMPAHFDFIIYSKTVASDNESVTYKKIITEVPVEETQFDVVGSDYKFILSEIHIGDKTIVTNFSCHKHNYFVAGNVLHLAFFKYYLKQYHANELKDILLEDKDVNVDVDIFLSVLDQNVNKVDFDKNNQLQINKENYEIMKIA
jgi:hypothetical protein